MSQEKEKEYNSKSRAHELDEFWDISSLVVTPAKKVPTPDRHFDTSVAEFELPEVTKDPKSIATSASQASRTRLRERCADAALPLPPRPIDAPAAKKEAVPPPAADPIVYNPQHPLIEQVTILPWRTNFPYYERFCQIARDLFGRKGEKCEPVAFFSYMPQYDQMNRAQLAWYLYFRELVRKGEYPRTEHSYIFLLLFEIINLPDLIPPEKGIALLCRIWTNYREDYPLLDRYVCEWICDYCLLHRLPLPVEHLGAAVSNLLPIAQLREFYVHHNSERGTQNDDVSVYLECCSNYDYKKSRAYQSGAKAAELFDNHIPQALSRVLNSITTDSSLFSQIKMQSTTVTRDTFVGALCSHRVKCKIEVRYRSFSRSHELRFFITDVIKYSENKLRQILGYKSKLSIYALSDPIKMILNTYFAQAFPKNNGKTPEAIVRPEYERLYDLPDVPMSAKEAARIEQASWSTTQRLVDAFESIGESVQMPEVPHDVETSTLPGLTAEQPAKEENSALNVESNKKLPDAEAIPFLRFALAQDAKGQLSYCRSIGKMPETLADAVNEFAVDLWGDILLEESDGGAFFVIEDYLEQAQALLG